MSMLLDHYSDGPKSAQKMMTRWACEGCFERYQASMDEIGGSEWQDSGGLYEL